MPIDEMKLWTVGTWKGHPNYECLHCPYKTLDARRIRMHVRHAHPAAVRAAQEAESPAALIAALEFASPAARQAAQDLPPEAIQQLASQEPSSQRGYTVDDVTAAQTAATTNSDN